MHTAEASIPDPYLDRQSAAETIAAHYFPISPRSLREWARPATITVAGRACARRSEWLAEAQRRLDEALFRGSDGRAEHCRRMAVARATRSERAAA